MEMLSIEKELQENSYPGRGIIIGRSKDGTKAVTAYFIMGRSENSRNRIFVEDGEGIRTQAFDPSKLVDRTGTCVGKQDDRYKRRSDRYHLRRHGSSAYI